MCKHFLDRIAIIAAWGMLALTAEAQPTLFVDVDKPASGNGLSWQTALNDLEAAVGIAFGSPGLYNEIRVAEGTYTPDTQVYGRQATFHVVNGVAIWGQGQPPISTRQKRWLSQMAPNGTQRDRMSSM